MPLELLVSRLHALDPRHCIAAMCEDESAIATQWRDWESWHTNRRPVRRRSHLPADLPTTTAGSIIASSPLLVAAPAVVSASTLQYAGFRCWPHIPLLIPSQLR